MNMRSHILGHSLASWQRYEVWSNVFYIVPLGLAILSGMVFHMVSIGTVFFFGLLYHLSRETKYGWIDNKAAWVLIAGNWIIVYLGNFHFPYFPIAVLFLVLALYYHYIAKRKQFGGYGLNHGMWHLYGSLITLFSLLTFLHA